MLHGYEFCITYQDVDAAFYQAAENARVSRILCEDQKEKQIDNGKERNTKNIRTKDKVQIDNV